MSALDVFSPEEKALPPVPATLSKKYPEIISTKGIHGGWPRIKGTRILAVDILRARVRGHSLDSMVSEFKKMDVRVTKKQLELACAFTIAWASYLQENEAKTSKVSK